MKPSYVYEARYVSNYDGDTVRLDISLGFGVWLHNQAVRLHGIDTPELRGDEREEGIRSKNFVENRIRTTPLVIETFKDKQGKYGRWIAIIYFQNDEGDYINLNESLVANGYAEYREY